MDLKTSRKEKMPQPIPGSAVEVLVSDVFDIFPVYDTTDPLLIIDAEMLDDDQTELLDRSMFGCVRQRGQDPVNPSEGIQWSEALAEEVSVPVIMGQLTGSVQEDGPGVQIDFSTTPGPNGEPQFTFGLSLTNSS
jgi:hypothetical protein